MKTFFLLAMFSAGLFAQESIRPFETDYCTMFVEGNWGHCCLEHDLRYWVGGESADQDASDLRLKACVQKASGKLMANLIYYSVRSGHYSPIKHRYKWSWGWGDEEVFEPLTLEQKRAAAIELRRSSLDAYIVETFIEERLSDEGL